MLPEKIMQSDFLDLLFENRNKLYGAYAIRRSYNKTIASSITITVFIVMIFCLMQLIHNSKQTDRIVPVIITPDNILSEVEPVKPLPEKPVTKPPVANHFKQIINSTPVIVSDDKKSDMHDIDEIDKSLIGNENLAGNEVTESLEMLPGRPEGT